MSRASLAIQTLTSLILGRELILVGEGTELFVEPIPVHLAGKLLSASEIGAKTGLNVIGIRTNGKLIANPPAAPASAPRSYCRVCMAILQPCPSSPMRQSAGIRASVKNVSVKPYSPVILRIGRVSMPGTFMGDKK